MAGGLHWNSPSQVGSHHIAKGFANNGWKVGFLSDPISPLHLLHGINPELSDRWEVYRNGGKLEYDDRIWCYVPAAFFTPNNRPLLRSAWLQRHWNQLTFPPILHRIKQNGFDSVDILYLCNANDLYLLDKIDFKKSVYRIADYNSGLPKSTPASREAEKEIASKVDVVLYTAKNLEGYVNSLNPRTSFYFPNGVDYKHFANGSSLVPQELEQIKKPIALYVGAMFDWFDFELINQTARKLPEISFVFIGRDDLAKKRLMNLPNIHILGVKSFNELPAYIHNADVGVIPFDINNHADLLNSVNPLKLYEYMAGGLPVLSVDWKEMQIMNTPAILYRDLDDFITKIKEICNQENSNKQDLLTFASQHDWGKQVENLLTYCQLD
jgi:glycosyltransferase involved in cell wall biosynthesis